MRHVDFSPAGLADDDNYRDKHDKVWRTREWWNKWVARAEEARNVAIQDVASGHEHEFKSELWSELKDFLLRKVFHGNCAYCETPVTGGFFGDAEHYRPKGKVTVEAKGSSRTVMCSGKPHPGYYWLAYDWRNLLPSCDLCNSGDGKMNQFPVAGRHVCDPREATDPNQLDQLEKPLLLNPYKDDPSKHLRFGDRGIVAEVDQDRRGRASIAVYNLKREDLSVRRQRAQELAWADILSSMRYSDTLGLALRKYECGEAPYSSAARDYLRLKLGEAMARLFGP